ncbi:hypothetical protein Agub_g13509, partial [Astrephomene gubernaculifera]
MDTKPKLNLSALNGTSVPSRPPSPRMAPPVSARAPVREQQRGLSPRPGTHSVVATAAKKFVNAPLPASLRPAAALQESSALASDISEDSTSWTGEAALRTLIQTKHLTRTALADFLRDPLAWLVRFTRQLQAILLQLLQPKGNSCATSAAAAAKEAAAAATTTTTTTLPAAPLTNRTTPLSARGRTVASPISQRGSSGRYVAPASPRQQRAAKAASPAPTILLAAQQTIANVAQRPVVPVAAFALSAAAAVVLSGCWLLRRWRAAAEAQREMQQRAAAKRDVLARQKQRFQRALVVDSVNLELPPIKVGKDQRTALGDKDVQPGPVRVGQILQHKQPSQQQQQQGGRMGSAGGEQQSKQQRGGSNGSGAGQVPGLAGESLRQWQQFMMASRAEEVTNVSGKNARGGRSSAQQDSAASRPFKTMDDRTLSDLSERIRRANESGAAGVAPVITFEQLYANNKETDDEAMARRAAERKARWQKQQPGVNGHAAAPQPKPQPQPPAERKAPTAAPPASRNRAIKTTIPPDNPFAVGLFDNTPPVAAAAAAGSGPSAAGTRDPSSRPSSSGSSSSTTNVSHPGISTHSQDRSPMQKAPLRADAGSSSSTTSSGASITLSATGTWSTARRALPEFSSASSAPAGSPARRSVAAAASTLLETTSSTGSTSSSINCTALSRKPA